MAQLTDEQWLDLFDQAEALGIGFILLAGGEPLLPRGVIEAAGRMLKWKSRKEGESSPFPDRAPVTIGRFQNRQNFTRESAN